MSYPQSQDDSFTIHKWHCTGWWWEEEYTVCVYCIYQAETRSSPKFVGRNEWDGNIQSKLACCWWPNSNFPYTPPWAQPSHEIHWSRDILAACAATEGPKPRHDNVGILTFAPKSAAICPSNCASPQTPYLDFPDIWMLPGNNITSAHHPPNSPSTSSKKNIYQHIPAPSSRGAKWLR